MKRSFSTDQPEFMDVTQDGGAALEQDLRGLEDLNARFGGHDAVRGFLARWLEPRAHAHPQTKWRILDLATASGDIPRMIVDWARARKIEVEIDAVDFNAATLEIARRRGAAYPEIRFIHADILEYDNDAPHDIVICSQALHHFSKADAVRVLARCAALSRGAVLVFDLRRRRLGQFVVWLLTATIYRAGMIAYDSRLSIRRAFTPDELRALARSAGWKDFEHRAFFPVHQALWLEKSSEGLKN